MMKKKALIIFFVIGALSMIMMSAHYLYEDHSGILRRKEAASSLCYLVIFRTHVFFGLMAITLGPFQFVTAIREKSKSIHKLIGYAYFISVFISGLCGICIAPYAMDGWVTSTGFSLLGIVWLFVTIKSVLSIRNKDFNSHKRWSYFSYALTFTAITQRTLLLIPLLTSVPFMPVYKLSAWFPMILNLMVAHSLFKRSLQLKTKK